MTTIFSKEDWKQVLGTKEEFEKAQQERENDETERIMSLCPTCNGLKEVGGFTNIGEDTAELVVPCPDCQKDYYNN